MSSPVAKTDDDRASAETPPMPPTEASQRVGDTPAYDARARASQIRTRIVKVATTLRGVSVPDVSVSRLLNAHPPTIQSLLDYTRAGGWVSGDHPPQAELPGKIYGYAVAVPVVTVLYSLALIVMRPLRFLVAVLVIVLLTIFITII